MNKIESRAAGMIVDLIVTNVCNYKCHYCSPNVHSGSSGFPDYEKLLNFLNYLHTDVNQNKKYLIIGGGEPTIWPKLKKLILNIDDSYSINITTNGSRTIRWWKHFIDICIDKIFEIVISVHWESVDINHIIEVCKLLEKENIRVTVFLLADKIAIDKVKLYHKKLIEENLNININVKPVKDFTNGQSPQNYNQEDIDFINTQYFRSKKIEKHSDIPDKLIINGNEQPRHYIREIMSKKMNSFKGWNCHLGVAKLAINHDGRVFGAQCKTAVAYCYGNIYNDANLKITPQVVECTTEWCGCLTDIMIPKWK